MPFRQRFQLIRSHKGTLDHLQALTGVIFSSADRAGQHRLISQDYYSLDYLHPKSPFLPKFIESMDVSGLTDNPSLSLHLRFPCYHTFVTRYKKQEPQPKLSSCHRLNAAYAVLLHSSVSSKTFRPLSRKYRILFRRGI